jgi:hypothetical protein
MDHYEQAQRYLQEGNWAGYGAELEAMQNDLEALVGVTEQAAPLPGVEANEQ